MEQNYDVVIVGTGVAGLYGALQLDERLKVLLICCLLYTSPVHRLGRNIHLGLARLKGAAGRGGKADRLLPPGAAEGALGDGDVIGGGGIPGKPEDSRGGDRLLPDKAPGLGVAVQIFPLGRVGEEHPPGEVQLLMEGGKLLGQQAQADV